MNKISKKFGLLTIVLLVSVLGIKYTSAFFSDSTPSTLNTFAAASVFPTPTLAVTPTPTIRSIQPGDVVINEIMWMGTQGDSADEWIELRNMTGGVIDISNWVVD